MFIDSQLHLFSSAATPPTTAGEYKSESIALETVAEMAREGQGEPLEVVIQITEAFTSGGAATLELETITAPEATLATDASHYTTGALALADVAILGKKFRFPLNMSDIDADAAYFGVMATVATATMTAGAIQAWIQRAGEDQNSYS